MAHLDLQTTTYSSHPLDVVEYVMQEQNWRFDRSCDDEVSAEHRGKWCDYGVHLAWSPEIDAIHFTCAFDMRVPEARKSSVHRLLALVNDRLWLGHFGLWNNEGMPMYRHAVLLRGTSISSQQIEDLLDVAVFECERFYPAFQYVIWGGKPADEAIEASMIEPMGEA